MQEFAGWNGTLILALLPCPCSYTKVEDRTEHPFRAKGCFIGTNKEKRKQTRSEMNPGLEGFAKELEISQGPVAPHEICDTSHFWLGQKYRKNNAASSFSALALLFPHSQQGLSASQASSRLRIRRHRPRHRLAQTASSGFSFQPRALSQGRYFWSRKKNQMTHFVDLKNYFWAGACAFPQPQCVTLLMLPGHLQPPRGRWVHKGHCTLSLQIQLDPRAWRLPVAGDVVQSPLFTFQLGPYPFRPPGPRLLCRGSF